MSLAVNLLRDYCRRPHEHFEALAPHVLNKDRQMELPAPTNLTRTVNSSSEGLAHDWSRVRESCTITKRLVFSCALPSARQYHASLTKRSSTSLTPIEPKNTSGLKLSDVRAGVSSGKTSITNGGGGVFWDAYKVRSYVAGY